VYPLASNSADLVVNTDGMVCCMAMLNCSKFSRSKFSRPEGRPTRVRAWDWLPNWAVGRAVGRASARQSLNGSPCALAQPV
jgi:hypothetical protein